VLSASLPCRRERHQREPDDDKPLDLARQDVAPRPRITEISAQEPSRVKERRAAKSEAGPALCHYMQLVLRASRAGACGVCLLPKPRLRCPTSSTSLAPFARLLPDAGTVLQRVAT